MGKVLVVEDNELNIKLFCDLLSIKHHTVVIARYGKEVLELVETEMPDLILMDVQLQDDISGLDITRHLKDNSHTSHIPIIVITAFAMKHDEVKVVASGCDMYLFKPISIDTFFVAIDKYVPL